MNSKLKNDFTPDFYFVSSHGVGALSFMYYLSLIGAPTSNMMGTYANGKKSPLKYPVDKTQTIYARGISVDRALFDSAPLTYGNDKQKIIQLIRDPVDILTSIYNMQISRLAFGEGINFNLLNKGDIIKFFTQALNITIMFSSMRNSISSKEKALVLNTSDISGSCCQETIKIVKQYLSIDKDIDLKHISNFEIAYNSFPNRCWMWQKPKRFIIGPEETDIGGFYIFPASLHDYCANYFSCAHVIDIFTYENDEYVVSIPECDYCEINKITPSSFWDEHKREAMKKVIDIWFEHIDTTRKIYNKYCITWENTINIIRSNSRFYNKFMKLMKHEISMPMTEVPKKVESWKHFHSL